MMPILQHGEVHPMRFKIMVRNLRSKAIFKVDTAWTYDEAEMKRDEYQLQYGYDYQVYYREVPA